MNIVIKEIIINPKNIFQKKIFWNFKLIILPYPDIDNDTKTILTIKISI